MSEKKKDFYGKEVADAIKNACADLSAAQEDLDIEVVETGSTGIFGLRRKKAHIRAVVKEVVLSDVTEKDEKSKEIRSKKEKPGDAKQKSRKKTALKPKEKTTSSQKNSVVAETGNEKQSASEEQSQESDEGRELTAEDIETIRLELVQLLELMGYPATVKVEAKGTSIQCCIESDLEDVFIGQDGKTLDSMQYLLRKMIARKIPDRLRLSVDVGNYRERRQEELKVRALELTEQVKESGKTQVIPALSPSERRVVHMALQDDKEIRSRSVGDGLFKKILIYKPGKGKKGGNRKHSGSHGRRNNGPRQKKEE